MEFIVKILGDKRPKVIYYFGMNFRKEIRVKHKGTEYRKIKILFLTLVLGVLTVGCSTNEAIDKAAAKAGNTLKFSEQSVQNQADEKTDNYVKRKGTLMEFKDKLDTSDFSWQDEKFTEEEQNSDDEMSWQGDKGSYLYTEPGYIYYAEEEYSFCYASLLYEEDDSFRNDFDRVTEGAAPISGMTDNEAVNIVQNIMDKYEIHTGNAKVYPLNTEVLKKLSLDYMSDAEYEEYIKEQNNQPMKREFTQDDEAYLVVMNLMAGEYPLYNNEYYYGRDVYRESFVWALINKDKIIALYAEGLYEMKDTNTVISNILTIDEAKQKLEKKYKDVLFSDTVVCTDIEIRYIAVNSGESGLYDFIPAYVFELQYPLTPDISEGENSVSYITQKVLLDAENGKWVE